MESSGKKYEEKHTVNAPGDSDMDARQKFLEAMNSAKVFLSPSNTLWPLFYTRVAITSSSEFKLKKPIPETLPEAPIVEKKPRKPRSPNKPKAKTPEPGIKPRNTRGKKK